jgi:DNA polymerase-3 subunit epsilon
MDNPDLGPDFRVLKRVPNTRPFADLQGWQWTITDALDHGFKEVIAVIDFETTGLNKVFDEVIELGIALIGITDTGIELIGVGDWLNQPSKPISAEVTELTGITNEMVAGKMIDFARIKETYLANANSMVAHNADFDRAFHDRYFGNANKPWYCTSKGGDIDWKALGQKSAGLENLLIAHGWFYDAHRAVIDCIATAHLLSIRPDALSMMLERGNRTGFKIKAYGSPFSKKDDMKARGYRWDGDDKVWWIIVSGDEAREAELAALDALYFNASGSATVSTILPTEKYSSK